MTWAVLLKLASGRSLQKNPIEDILNKVRRLSCPAIFYKVERGILLVNFKTEKDQKWVLKGGPWSFDGNAILLQKLETGIMEDDFENTKINIWVQIRRLPFQIRCFKYASMLASYAGDLIGNDSVNNPKLTEFSGQFVRIRVLLNRTKPICPGLFLQRENRKPVWFTFKYEKLLTMCFKCGLLNHDSRSCLKVGNKTRSMYGSSLRAEATADNIPVWTDDLVDNGEGVVVSLPESFAHPLASGNNDEVQAEAVLCEETPMLIAVNEGISMITAPLSDMVNEITVPISKRQMEITECNDSGQVKVMQFPRVIAEGFDSDFNISFLDHASMTKPIAQSPNLKRVS